jgi:hypothetical protein
MTGELYGIGTDQSRYYPGISFEELRKTYKIPTQTAGVQTAFERPLPNATSERNRYAITQDMNAGIRQKLGRM